MMKDLDDYVQYLSAHGKSKNTVKLYRGQISFAMGHSAFESISSFHRFINQRRTSVSQKSFNSLINSLKSFSKFCILAELDIDSRILNEIDQLSTYSSPEPVQERRAYTDDEVARIMSVRMSPWRWQFCFTALNFGLRAGEIRMLNMDDVDLDGGCIKVRASISKSKRTRYVPIVDENMKYLRTWKELRKNQVYYLESNRKTRVSARSAGHWTNQSREAGVHIAAHNFRYTFATRLYQESKDIVLVQHMLGHSSPEVTRVYLKLTREDFDHAFRQLSFRVY